MWNSHETCHYIYSNDTFSTYLPIIGFDFDGTLIDFKTDKINDNIIIMLNKFVNQYNIVVFSNQLGINRNKTTHEVVRARFKKLMDLINKPIHIFYSSSKDKYRKPNTGMYELYKQLIKIQKSNIKFYCGDAAGRPKDFSTSDLYFANNCNLVFKTPEEIFENSNQCLLACKKIKSLELYKQDTWEDGLLVNNREILKICNINKNNHDISNKLGSKNLILLIGPPGSGKSTLSEYYSKTYNLSIISKDINANVKYRKKQLNESLNDDKNGIIIDELNSTEKKRNFWIDQVKHIDDWKIITIFIDISKQESLHLCNYRFLFNDKKYIPPVVVHKYYKDLDIPTKADVTFLTAFTKYDFNYKLRFT